jgi:hypothetical protein
MWQLLNEMIWRPWGALISSFEVLAKGLPPGLTIDSMISRAAHTLSRSEIAASKHFDAQQCGRTRCQDTRVTIGVSPPPPPAKRG